MDKTATVKDLIEYLEKNFKPEDKMCFWHEGGAWCECEHVHKFELNKWFLRKVSEEKKERMEDLKNSGIDCSQYENDYRMVDDNYVLVY